MNMTETNKERLMELLGEIRQWNNTDIECYDDTTPNMVMLEARKAMIDEVFKLVKKINKKKKIGKMKEIRM